MLNNLKDVFQQIFVYSFKEKEIIPIEFDLIKNSC